MRKWVFLLTLALIAVVMAAPVSAQQGTIVDIAVGDARFDTLVAAVTAADLVETLSGPGPFTVFAPTDDAFAALPAGTVEALLANIPALTDVLTYHVVAGSVPASQVVTLNSATTLEGSDVTIRVTEDGVVLNGSVNVIITDIEASNGIIHVIDAVLLPPVSGLNDLRLVTTDSPVFGSRDGQNATGDTVRTCQTFFVTQTFQNFGRLRDVGGWIDLSNTIDVAESYGVPGGQERIPGC
jgi:uncharacterized surface protein with fasciclin (FAS1) repeats